MHWDQSGCNSARCLPHLVHFSRGWMCKSLVVSRTPYLASLSNVMLL
jgi:hypothetical protein